MTLHPGPPDTFRTPPMCPRHPLHSQPCAMCMDAELDEWRCADCQRPLIDCPGQARTLPAQGAVPAVVICEPCSVRRAIAGVNP